MQTHAKFLSDLALVTTIRTVRATLRLAVYRQSVRLGTKSLETHDQYFFQLNTCSCSPYVTSPLMRGWVCRLQLVLVLASAVNRGSESRETHYHILLSQIRNSPSLEGQVPIFISPRNRVAQFYPQALGPLFVASYDSQGYGEGIRTRFNTGFSYKNKNFWKEQIAYFHLIRHEPHRKPHIQKFIVAAGRSLQSRCLATKRGYTDPHTLFDTT
jgi:predicted nucleic acid-binding Zn finger protein